MTGSKMGRRAVWGLLLISLFATSIALSLPASAMEGLLPGQVPGLEHGQTIVIDVSLKIPGPDIVAQFPAARDHHTYTPIDPPCAEELRIPDFIDPVTGERIPQYVCIAWWGCGGERIDDVYTGRISGPLAGGKYAQYVSQVVTAIGVGPGVSVPAETLSEWLLQDGLGDPTGATVQPVFYWCQSTNSTEIELFEVPYNPSFGWDTDFLTEYPIDTLRQDVLDELLLALSLYKPELRAIPPLDGGFTYVQFPMWLWVHRLNEREVRWGVSDLGNIHVVMRAEIVEVQWELDGDTISCTVDDMVAYDASAHDVADDLPGCHYVFEQLGTVDINATLVYEVEERTSIRLTTIEPFPPVPFTPHPTRPTVELTTAVTGLEIHQLLALNVAND